VLHLIYCYDECHYAECRYLSVVMLSVISECRYAECCNAECRYAECRYAECCYAECHYAECSGAAPRTYPIKYFGCILNHFYVSKLVHFRFVISFCAPQKWSTLEKE
jgi:hypothetical protein